MKTTTTDLVGIERLPSTDNSIPLLVDNIFLWTFHRVALKDHDSVKRLWVTPDRIITNVDDWLIGSLGRAIEWIFSKTDTTAIHVSILDGMKLDKYLVCKAGMVLSNYIETKKETVYSIYK